MSRKRKSRTEESEFQQQLLDQEGPLKAEDFRKISKVVDLIYIPRVPEPKQVGIGIPAELLRRRPDVRQAERLAAAQSEQIGIAKANLYPAFSLNGTVGYSANTFPDLFRYESFNGSVGPSFNWNLLNYGRIVNNVRLQDATFQQLVYAYQNTVLAGNQEVEDGLVNYFKSHQEAQLLGRGRGRLYRRRRLHDAPQGSGRDRRQRVGRGRPKPGDRKRSPGPRSTAIFPRA